MMEIESAVLACRESLVPALLERFGRSTDSQLIDGPYLLVRYRNGRIDWGGKPPQSADYVGARFADLVGRKCSNRKVEVSLSGRLGLSLQGKAVCSRAITRLGLDLCSAVTSVLSNKAERRYGVLLFQTCHRIAVDFAYARMLNEEVHEEGRRLYSVVVSGHVAVGRVTGTPDHTLLIANPLD